MIETMRRLHSRGEAARGICVDSEGAALGSACILVRRTEEGYRCVAPEEARAIQTVALPNSSDPDWLFDQCRRIRDALQKGEIALAQIYGLQIPIGELDHAQLQQLASTASLIKANFNPDQPRVPEGEPDAGQWEYVPGYAKPRDGGDSSVDAANLVDVAYQGHYHDELVRDLAERVRSSGGGVVTEVPLFPITGRSARADMIVRPRGAAMPIVVEVKTGPRSAFTPSQRDVYRLLPIGGHVIAIKNGLEAVGLKSGEPLPPMRLLIVYSDGPGHMDYDWWPPLSK